jgi:hypothetical protein
MMAWTDYPIVALGDEVGKEAPIREVTVLGWDGNKYAEVEVEGVRTSFKAGYLYTKPGRMTKNGWRTEGGRSYTNPANYTVLRHQIPVANIKGTD